MFVRRPSRIASAVLVLAVLGTGSPWAAAAGRDITETCDASPPAGFHDVTPDNVHVRRIDCIKALGITTGTTADTYAPGHSLTRGQLASFLDRTLAVAGEPLPGTSTDHFDDDAGSPHERAINRLASAGIVSTSSRQFGVSAIPTRAEMAGLTDAVLRHAGVLSTSPPPPDFFMDDSGLPDAEAIDRLADAGIISGRSAGIFAPSEPLRRDQMATFLANAADAVREGPGTHDHCRMQAPDQARFDTTWYQQQCEMFGIPIVASGAVDPAALRETARVFSAMLGRNPRLHVALASSGFYFILLGEREGQTDPPEYRYLKTDPVTDWDERARGLGGSDYASAGEENVLCLDGDRYAGESILIHEFSHSVLNAGIAPVIPGFIDRLVGAYEDAMAAGLWQGTYAAENLDEYWAEGVQSWFSSNAESDPPNGIHGLIDTREELLTYDPGLAALIAEGLGTSDWSYACP